MIETPDDKWLIKESLAGDVEAFGLLHERHREKVEKIVRGHVRHQDDAPDLIQQIWIQVIKKLRTFKATAPFEHWLARVAIRLCYARLREHRDNPEISFADLGNRDRARIGLEALSDD